VPAGSNPSSQPRCRCLCRAGRHEEARASIGKAFTAIAHGRDLALAAELHRARAVLLRADPGDRGAAEADLRCALEIGRQQEALSLQLRAARDLARLLAERGERLQAADLLEGVYREFKEGFATPDLTEAKALLNELHA
jgi:predicted ATPase